MDSQLSSYPNWNNLPNEIKLKIIRNTDKNSRLALKACSLNDHQLVASIPFRRLHRMYLWNEDDGKWHIDITRTMYGCEESFIFETFEEFKKQLEEEIENSDCIGWLELNQEETSNQLTFRKAGELLKVRELIFPAYNEDSIEILNQIDPSHLKNLQFFQNDNRRDVFETPQVKQVYHLQVREALITDDQLLNMENSELLFESTKYITLAGINQFIKKRLSNLDNKPVIFRIEFSEDKTDFYELFQGFEIERIVTELPDHLPDQRGVFRVGSNLNKYQLEIGYCPSYIEGSTICKSHHSESHHTLEPIENSFKSIICVAIEPGRLTIAERNTAPVTYIFDSNDDLQTKLTEEMNKINYIEHLKLQDTYLYWQLCPPNKQVTVGKLSVLGGSFDSDFLRQIEPIHLKEITISVDSDDGKMYNMPQFLHAQKLDISNCWIQDEDLIRTNAIQVNLTAGAPTILADSGINKFIKMILTKLNLHDYNFQIGHSGDESASERIEGLDILNFDRISPIVTRIIVNSPFPEFKLELLDRRRMIIGKRITAEDAEKPPQIDIEDVDDEDDDDVNDDNDVELRQFF